MAAARQPVLRNGGPPSALDRDQTESVVERTPHRFGARAWVAIFCPPLEGEVEGVAPEDELRLERPCRDVERAFLSLPDPEAVRETDRVGAVEVDAPSGHEIELAPQAKQK